MTLKDIKSWKFGALIALACSVAPAPLLAQTTSLTAPGAVVRPASNDDFALVDVATDGKSPIQIDVIALDGTDPIVKLLSARNHETVLADNDDGGGSLNARLMFDPGATPAALDANGHITLRIDEYSLEGRVGKYAIIASTLERLTPEKTLSFGSTERVTFDRGGASHLYAFNAAEGDLIELRLNAVAPGQGDDEGGSSVDPVLKVYASPFPSTDPIQSNDDGPEGGLDSLLRFAVPATGTYYVSAENLNSDAGYADLSLKKAAPPPPPPAPTRLTPAQLGRGLCGEITADAPMANWFDTDQHYALYSLSGRRSDAITLRKSGDVDVQVGYLTPMGFAHVDDEWTTGDDGNAQTLRLKWEKDGDLHIRVSAAAGTHYGLGSGGADQLARCQ